MKLGMKAREFIVQPFNPLIHGDTGLCIPYPEKSNASNTIFIHVIEYSAYQSLEARHKKLLEALEFECGNRCAIGINPCNAREAIEADRKAGQDID